MKTMTCKQLGGACEQAFHANTFEEIGQLSQQHSMEMFQKGDAPHMQALAAMRQQMTEPKIMVEWVEGKMKEFDALPEDN